MCLGWRLWRNSFQALFFCAVTALGGLSVLGPVQAIDCTKAQSGVEQSICSNANLKQMDAELAKSYFGLLRSIAEDGVPSEREVLLADQRNWLQRRETMCGAAGVADLPECVRSVIDQRSKQLTREWGASSVDRDPSKGRQLLIGGTTLLVSTPCADSPGYAISYKHKEITCGANGLYGEAPLVVKRRITNANAEAMLLQSHDGGEMNCSHFYVLAVQASRELQVQEFGANCLTPGNGGIAFRSTNGFEFRRPATAATPGERMEWDWETGISKSVVPYVAEGGESMRNFVNAGAKEFKDPLKNAEFYRAVSALPPPDRQAFLVSLSGLNDGCDCAGPIDYSLYGLRNTADVYSMSGCGIYLEGHYVRCSGADALAVWDKRIGKFYFAIVIDGENGKRRSPVAIHAFPAIAAWTDAARVQFTDWQNSARW